jgi:competence protein ComEC
VVGAVVPILAVPLALACNSSLWLVDECVAWAGRWPLSYAWVAGPAGFWVAGFYAAAACWGAFPGLRPPRRWCLAILAGWSAVGLAVPISRAAASRDLVCTFLSVGHGCCAVLELPDGRTLVYDAGQLSSPLAAARSISGFLWQRGKVHVDAVVISHADLDHYNALPDLVNKFSVGAVYVAPPMLESRSRATQALWTALAEARVPVRTIYAGDRLAAEHDCRIEVLHPPKESFFASDNANSLVLVVQYRGRRILLTGDLESPGLDDVLAEEPLDCDVALAPHHGSANSNPPGFAQWCKPEWVVISGSGTADLARVEASFRGAGARVLHTARVGSVAVRVGAAGMVVSAWHAP